MIFERTNNNPIKSIEIEVELTEYQILQLIGGHQVHLSVLSMELSTPVYMYIRGEYLIFNFRGQVYQRKWTS